MGWTRDDHYQLHLDVLRVNVPIEADVHRAGSITRDSGNSCFLQCIWTTVQLVAKTAASCTVVHTQENSYFYCLVIKPAQQAASIARFTLSTSNFNW